MTGTDPDINAARMFKLFNDWVKKNWFSVAAIIFIMALVLYDLGTIQKQKQDVADECNEFWAEQVKESCPQLIAGRPVPVIGVDPPHTDAPG